MRCRMNQELRHSRPDEMPHARRARGVYQRLALRGLVRLVQEFPVYNYFTEYVRL